MILKEQTGIILPEHEAASVAMHLINAETENGDLHNFITMMKIMDEADRIIKKSLKFTMDKDSYNYSRFATHTRYLIQRLQSGVQVTNQVNTMRRTLMRLFIWRAPFKCPDGGDETNCGQAVRSARANGHKVFISTSHVETGVHYTCHFEYFCL